MSQANGGLPAEDVLPNELSHVTQQLASQRHDLWRANYHEASIYIEEGLNNDKFENHPRKRASKLVRRAPPGASALSSISQSGGAQQQQQQLDEQSSHIASAHQASPLISAHALIGQANFAATECNINSNSNNNNNNKGGSDNAGTASNNSGSSSTSNNNSNSNNGFPSYTNNNQQQQQQQLDGGSKARGAFLLGGQYTTIETYILVHNRYFYQLDLAASIVLLLLALVEPPAVDGYQLSPLVHASLEMLALGVIAIELLLKFRWMGPRRFFGHGRTVSKLIVLLAMNFEAIVILLRQSIHARYSRALRPIFLMDNHYCHGLRRAVRQIFQSLPPIIDMFTLAMFFLFVFSIFGFYLFAPNNSYFSDMPRTVGNLLVLATTANLPDIMMPSYAVSRWSAVYFVLFIIIHLFLFTNLTMAAVYEIFTRKEKEKFHKLLLHRRKACQKAFKLLVSRRQPHKIQYRQFMGLMRYLNQKCSMLDAYLIFKALDTDQSGSISLEEFYQIYDFINLKWDLIYPKFRWHDRVAWLPSGARAFLVASERVIQHKLFEWCVDVLIVAQALLQFIEASAFDLPIPGLKIPLLQSASGGSFSNATALALATNNNSTALMQASQQVTPQGAPQSSLSLNLGPDVYVRPDRVSTAIFICVFLLEAVARCLALGARKYWAQRWNRFDLAVLLVSLAGLVNGSLGGYPFGWVLVLRVLRLMRAFEFKRRYKDMWQTLTYILLKRFVSMTCVVMILYYFFAIVGMELMGDYDLRNCCQNTSIESQFKFDNSTEGAKYYLNDFGDVIASYLTLFSMTSNTYWLATMEAYSIVAQTNWLRLFFGLYYLGSIIVMNIVIAFILESFLFHIHYRNKMTNSGHDDDDDDTNLFTVSVTLSSVEVDFLRKNLTSKRDTEKLERTVELLRARRDQRQWQKAAAAAGPRGAGRQLSFASMFGWARRAPEAGKGGEMGDCGGCGGGGGGGGGDGDDGRGQHEDGAEDETVSLLRGAKRRAKQRQRSRERARDASGGARQAETALADPTKNEPRPIGGATSGGGGGSSSGSESSSAGGQHATPQASPTRAQQPRPAAPTTRPAPAPARHAPTKSVLFNNQTSDSDDQASITSHRPEWYLIYQAEQIRNKFSFTMKMYADEVGAWLAEAEQADQDEMSLMISRNQLRAEHVAMARLARRNFAELHTPTSALDDGHLLDWMRPRSWSTSGGAGAGGAGNSAAGDGVSPVKRKSKHKKQGEQK